MYYEKYVKIHFIFDTDTQVFQHYLLVRLSFLQWINYLGTFGKKCICEFFRDLYSVSLIYIIQPSKSTHCRYLTNRNENICPQMLCMWMLIYSSFVYKRSKLKTIQRYITGEWIKRSHIHTMEFQNTILRERSQTQNTYHTIAFIWNSSTGKTYLQWEQVDLEIAWSQGWKLIAKGHEENFVVI